MSGLITKLYTDEKLDAAGSTRPVEAAPKENPHDRQSDRRSAFASLYDPLTSLRGRLARRVDVDLAILNTLELKPEEVKAERIKTARANALDQLSDLEADLNQVPNGSAWLPFIRANELRHALTSNQSDGVIAAVQKKLDSGSSLKDIQQRQFLARPSFRMLSAALAKLNQAEQTSPSAGDQKAETGTFAALVAALEGYEDNGGSAEARKVYETLDAAEKSAIDEGALIDQAVREHFMNYNLQVVASQEMLSKLLSDQQSTTGPVTDFILGANVSGTEWTTTDISVATAARKECRQPRFDPQRRDAKQHRRRDRSGFDLHVGLSPVEREKTAPIRWKDHRL